MKTVYFEKEPLFRALFTKYFHILKSEILQLLLPLVHLIMLNGKSKSWLQRVEYVETAQEPVKVSK